MFMHLRHMTCQLTVFSREPNADTGVLQLVRCCGPTRDVAFGCECHLIGLDKEIHGSQMVVYMSGFWSTVPRLSWPAVSCRMLVFLSTWKYSQGSRPVYLLSRIMASSVLCRRSADGHGLPRCASVRSR